MPPRKGWAAVYCRLSKEDEEKTAHESESIRNQRALLLAWAAEHGYRIYRVYTDEDYSGIDRARPGFNAMLADARAGRFEVILAKTQSRFTGEDSSLPRRVPPPPKQKPRKAPRPARSFCILKNVTPFSRRSAFSARPESRPAAPPAWGRRGQQAPPRRAPHACPSPSACS